MRPKIINRRAVLDTVMGLSLGDAFGQRWFFRSGAEARREIIARSLPDVPGGGRLLPGETFGPGQIWHWTDDTAMALSIVRVLLRHGEIVEDQLARAFADTHAADPGRGYGAGMHDLLPRLGAEPGAWHPAAQALFGGQGSFGNGAAMRAAPVGAWFGPDIETTRRTRDRPRRMALFRRGASRLGPPRTPLTRRDGRCAAAPSTP